MAEPLPAPVPPGPRAMVFIIVFTGKMEARTQTYRFADRQDMW